jgi:NADPH:quinone reductase
VDSTGYADTVRAACYVTQGPDHGRIEVRELPTPEPGAGEVRVRVAVSGVNPTDWKARRPGSLSAFDAPLVVPNQDGSGTIDAVGDGVDPARIGERVWLYNAQWQRPHGTAAQWVTVAATQAVPLSDDTSFDLGASLGIPAITAHRCLFSDGALAPGTPVLVHGGAGAVGHYAIELAVRAGAVVCATVSSDDKARLAAAAGAQRVVNYRADDVAAAVRAWAPAGVRRIVEVDLVSNLELDCQVLAHGGTVAAYGGAVGDVSVPRSFMVLNTRIEGVFVYTIPDGAKRSALADIAAALREGALTTLPLHRYSLSDAAAAHDAVEDGAVGKVLIDIP